MESESVKISVERFAELIRSESKLDSIVCWVVSDGKEYYKADEILRIIGYTTK